VPAVKAATATIPIVFPMANDPVGGGIVASLSRPGGNVTGISVQARDLAGKRLELLRELRPQLRRLGVIADQGYREGALVVDELAAAARQIGVDIVTFGIGSSAEIASVLADLSGQVQALFVVVSAVVAEGTELINRLAANAGIPTMYNTRDYVSAGGLMSYGPNYPDLFRRTAEIVDKILRGANPADIPVEQPTRFDLVINLRTAKALGLDIPPTLLARADEVIE
jgi:putative ABC transport system substrate-binding protein